MGPKGPSARDNRNCDTRSASKESERPRSRKRTLGHASAPNPAPLAQAHFGTRPRPAPPLTPPLSRWRTLGPPLRLRRLHFGTLRPCSRSRPLLSRPAPAGWRIPLGHHGDPGPVPRRQRRSRQTPGTRGICCVPVKRLHEGRVHLCHRDRRDLRPPDVHSEKVPVPGAVECSDGCGCRLCGKLWGDKSGVAEVQQPLDLPGDRAASQRYGHRSTQLRASPRSQRSRTRRPLE